MTKKQKNLADLMLEDLKSRFSSEFYLTDLEKERSLNAEDIYNLTSWIGYGGEQMFNHADRVGYCEKIMIDFYKGGSYCSKTLLAIEPYVMQEWKKYVQQMENND